MNKHDKLIESIEISKSQRELISEFIDLLDEVNEWENIQLFTENINSELKKLSKAKRILMIKAFSDNLGASLISKGAMFENIKYIQDKVEKNWLEIIEKNKKIDVERVYRDLIFEWNKINYSISELKERKNTRKINYKNISANLGRIITGAGGICFDAHKLFTLTQPPNFVYSTIMVGAGIFLTGIDEFELFEK